MVTGWVIVGSGEPGEMVLTPLPPKLKLMVSEAVVALASSMAALKVQLGSVPCWKGAVLQTPLGATSPSSPVELTMKGSAAQAGLATIRRATVITVSKITARLLMPYTLH